MSASPYELPQPYTTEEIHASAEAIGCRIQDLIVLQNGNDPFHVGTAAPAGAAEWFADVWGRFGFSSGVHVRRVHYRAQASGDVFLPSGEVYRNADEHSVFLGRASRWARDLGLIDASLFVDRKNQPIENYANRHLADTEPSAQVLLLGEEVPWSLPEAGDWQQPHFAAHPLPALQLGEIDIDPQNTASVTVDGYDYDVGDQPYYEALWIEKSTMDDVLDPLCRQLGVDYSANKGFPSKTRAVELLHRAVQVDKPLRVFVISDYDPAGSHMPVSIARNLEFYRARFAPDTEVVVHHIGMHRDWAVKYDLPRTPIKADPRKANFEALHGEGCVELDALEALHPGALAEEVRTLIAGYRDDDLRDRLNDARGNAKRDANDAWQSTSANTHAEVEAVRDDASALVASYRGRLDDLQARRDETVAPFIERVQRLQMEATAALKPLREEHAALVEEYQADAEPHRERLGELWDELDGLADAVEIELPERPAPEVDPDEAGALYDSRLHWWDQLQHYHQVQGRQKERPAKQCVQCDAEFTPKRSSAMYCSTRCGRQAWRIQQRDARPPKTCAICGAEFQPIREDAKFCSTSCAKKDYHRRKREAAS